MSNLLKYYFSPAPAVNKTNEYVNNFYEQLAGQVPLTNYKKKTLSRSIDYLKYSIKSDVMILNWPEDILHLRFGVLQLLLSYFTFTVYKLRGGKLIWICHNKDSHTKRLRKLSYITRKFYTRLADIILVHSKDALQYFQDDGQKVFFLNHPVYDIPKINLNNNPELSLEVLIWGKICAYKGLNQFINNYKKYNCNFNVLITGQADKHYLKILEKNALHTHIAIEDKFISDEMLESYFKQCKIIVLPYLDSDTFSSGALIHSINSNKIILGPRVGNFLDLEEYGACITYLNEEELFIILKKLLSDEEFYQNKLKEVRVGIQKYYENNSWDNFIIRLLEIINNGSVKN